MTEELVADGKIDPADVGKITLMNVGMWASAIPQGPLKPPPYAAIANASRNGLGATADALETIVKDAPAGLKTSELTSLLKAQFGNAARVLEKCPSCTIDIDKLILQLKAEGRFTANSLKEIDDAFKKFETKPYSERSKTALVKIWMLRKNTCGLTAQSVTITTPQVGSICQFIYDNLPKYGTRNSKTTGLLQAGGEYLGEIISGSATARDPGTVVFALEFFKNFKNKSFHPRSGRCAKQRILVETGKKDRSQRVGRGVLLQFVVQHAMNRVFRGV